MSPYSRGINNLYGPCLPRLCLHLLELGSGVYRCTYDMGTLKCAQKQFTAGVEDSAGVHLPRDCLSPCAPAPPCPCRASVLSFFSPPTVCRGVAQVRLSGSSFRHFSRSCGSREKRESTNPFNHSIQVFHAAVAFNHSIQPHNSPISSNHPMQHSHSTIPFNQPIQPYDTMHISHSTITSNYPMQLSRSKIQFNYPFQPSHSIIPFNHLIQPSHSTIPCNYLTQPSHSIIPFNHHIQPSHSTIPFNHPM